MFDLYIPISNYWIIGDNSNNPFKLIAEGISNSTNVINENKWNLIKTQINETH